MTTAPPSASQNSSSPAQRILVTGGAGFIGSHLVERFTAMGHHVAVVDDLSSGRRENLSSEIPLFVHDIRDTSVRDVVQTYAPTVVCHQAAQMDVRKSVDDPAFDAHVNLVGLLNILEGAKAGGALEHVLVAGSGGAMYGEQDHFPADENHPVRPESPYGLAKAVAEQYLDVYRRMHRISWTSLRYANVYGPRQNPHGEAGVVAIFCQRMLRGEGVTIFGDGQQTRDYVFVKDVAEANARALTTRIQGGFNVGTAIETSVVTLEETLRGLCGSKVPPTFAPARPGEQMRSVITPEKLLAATGFRPNTPLAEGLAETVESFRVLAAGG